MSRVVSKRRKNIVVAVLVLGGLVLLGAAAALTIFAPRDTIVFFYSPSQVAERQLDPGTRIRLVGLVAEGSLERQPDGGVSFAVTDAMSSVHVTYRGVLPEFLREGQGMAAEGSFDGSGAFFADTLLAKDEVPREVADALRRQEHLIVEHDAAAAGPNRSILYDIVEQRRIPNGGYTRVIVVDPKYRNEEDMKRLGFQLHNDTIMDRNAFIDIFDDKVAASNLDAVIQDRLSDKELSHFDAHFIGQYIRNINTGYHGLTISLEGLDGSIEEIQF